MHTSTSNGIRPANSATLVFAGLAYISLLYLYFPTLSEIGMICWNDDDYSHGLVLPFVTIYILWENRSLLNQRLTAMTNRNPEGICYRGLLLLIVGMLLLFVGKAGNSLFASWISFFPSMLGTTYLVWGTTITNFAAPALLLLLMAKPIPDSLVPKLFNPFQVFAAQVSAWILQLLHVPVHLVGNIIEIPNMQLMVEEACSGMRSLMALLTVALIVLSLVRMSGSAKLLVIALSILTALALNVFRVASTGVLAFFVSPELATGFFHTFSGLIVFCIGLTILYFAGVKISRYPWAKEKGGA